MKKVIIQRFFELMLTNILFSVCIAGFYYLDLIETEFSLAMSGGIFTLLYIVINIKYMRRCYFEVYGTKDYYIINYIAYAAFLAVNLLAYFVCSDFIYTIIFAIAKFVVYLGLTKQTHISVLVFHILMIVTVAIAPLGMKYFYKWRFNDY